ncbi:hypothetical protein EMEDMD4_570010 [Sinorhizobium medicae]|uniref:Uncharacterized protein n=1 Tax=Sinorhizobium medicae TaxID=110321 RepID=A0A508X7V0_9HYPH|nr:hypothetical protein EMEDMD4_570010 [Sinorhizobium medicae]
MLNSFIQPFELAEETHYRRTVLSHHRTLGGVRSSFGGAIGSKVLGRGRHAAYTRRREGSS